MLRNVVVALNNVYKLKHYVSIDALTNTTEILEEYEHTFEGLF